MALDRRRTEMASKKHTVPANLTELFRADSVAPLAWAPLLHGEKTGVIGSEGAESSSRWGSTLHGDGLKTVPDRVAECTGWSPERPHLHEAGQWADVGVAF